MSPVPHDSNDPKVRVAVFGLGYVGCVTAACLARDHHTVVGVEKDPYKLEALREGRSPISEPGLADLIEQGAAAGRLRVTDDAAEAVHATEMSLVCVGTPSTSSGGIDLEHVRNVSAEIGRALRTRTAGHVVCIRSTVRPGTVRNTVLPILESESGGRCGEAFHLAMNPEFLREGSAIRDFDEPPKVVIGSAAAGEPSDRADTLLRRIYAGVQVSEQKKFTVDLEVAELVKYADNAWHATKIAFTNEVGEICREVGVDSHRVMDIFRSDRQLNISEYYMRPGFAFGGSCLPKDLRALGSYARDFGLELPLLSSVIPSNDRLVQATFERITAMDHRRVGLYGLAFKPHTDDLRESPFLRLARQLLEEGRDLRIYDEVLRPDNLTGGNLAYFQTRGRGLRDCLVSSLDELVSDLDLLVVAHKTRQIRDWLPHRPPALSILDLTRVDENLVGTPGYQGISW